MRRSAPSNRWRKIWDIRVLWMGDSFIGEGNPWGKRKTSRKLLPITVTLARVNGASCMHNFPDPLHGGGETLQYAPEYAIMWIT